MNCLNCHTFFMVKPYLVKNGKKKYCSMECYSKYTNKGKSIACFNCKKNKWYPTNRWRRNKTGMFFCSRECNFIYQKGRNSSAYKHGEYNNFYIHGKENAGNSWEHRVIAEACLKRKLQEKEIVHHIDGDKRNNHPNNLYVFENMAKHLKAHKEGWARDLRSNLL